MTRVSNIMAITLMAASAALWLAGMVFSVAQAPRAPVGAVHGKGVGSAPRLARRTTTQQNARRFGMALNVHSVSDMSVFMEAVDAIAAIGARSLLIVTPLYQEDISSVQINRDPDRCPTITQLESIIERAHEHGMTTALMPVVLLRRPGTHQWRGRIAPDDWSQWWASYEIHILRMAELAQNSDVELFFVGSELNSTEALDRQWQHLIASVRDRYTGELTYSANWDRFAKVRFWNQLDVISVSAWFKVADSPDPTDEQLSESWRKVFGRLLAVADRWDRPVLLSEIGYPSLRWALSEPWNYVQGTEETPNTAVQKRGYEGFFAALEADVLNDARFGGFYCYEWDVYRAGGVDDFRYGLRGKPAFETVKNWFARLGPGDEEK